MLIVFNYLTLLPGSVSKWYLWSGLALIDSSETNSKNISRGHFFKEIDNNFIQISGGKLTGFRIIAKESLENLYNLEFKLNKLKFVDQILQLKNTINDEDVDLCIKHYSVVKPTDYLLRRTRISWFNSNGGCLLYTSPSPRDVRSSRMPSSA